MATSFSDASTASNGNSTTTNPTALPSDEALEILLSPDGYYTYLNIPKPDPSLFAPKYATTHASQHPDLQNASTAYENAIDLDQVKKNYRRLSLRHHPDRKTGDPETFRILHRAKVVLSSSKLRREYDLLGLDLDDEEELDANHHEDGDHHNSDNNNSEGGKEGSEEKEGDHGAGGKGGEGGKSSTETVMGHLASTTLAAVLQMVVRTGLMGLVSVILTRYTILTYLALGGLAFIATRIYTALKKTLGTLNFHAMKDVLSPLMIALGIYCMYRGRRFLVPSANGSEGLVDGDNASGSLGDGSGESGETVTFASWSWTFWFGETIVMTLFLSNSFENKTNALTIGFSFLSLLVTLWLRGKFWRYATLLGFQGIIALLVVMAFPIMEMILEEIVQDKMRKVGEKIRAHDARTKERLRKRKNAMSASTSS